MRTIRDRAACWWVARRLNRYLDGDPSASLTEPEVARLTEHLRGCAGCGGQEAEYRRLLALLHGIRDRTEPDDDSIERIRLRVRART